MRVLDASALLSYLEKAEGYETVRDAFSRAAAAGQPLWISSVNWGEVYYILIRHQGLEETEKLIPAICALPLEIVPVDESAAVQAAFYKAGRGLPYADCFAAALARLKKAELITADKDFHAVEKDIPVVWV